MTPGEMLLWKKLDGFALDDPRAGFQFTDRLARDNGWDLNYARRVVTAYKKFIFLCAISPQPVTPSDAVDQAWHLHMTYTESYWIDLCRNVIGKDIDHNPTKGGPAERDKFYNQYEGTLDLYQKKFKEVPPEDIWPPAHIRFSDINFVRVNKRTHWAMRKPTWKQVGIIAINIPVFFIGKYTGNWTFLFISGVITLCILGYLAGEGSSHSGGASGCGGCGGGMDGHSGCGGSSGCGSGCGGGCGGGGD